MEERNCKKAKENSQIFKKKHMKSNFEILIRLITSHLTGLGVIFLNRNHGFKVFCMCVCLCVHMSQAPWIQADDLCANGRSYLPTPHQIQNPYVAFMSDCHQTWYKIIYLLKIHSNLKMGYVDPIRAKWLFTETL